MTDPKNFPALGAAIEVVENVSAPEIFATEATYLGITGPNATVTLTSLRWDNSTEPAVLKRVVVARLVMPISAAQAFTISLYDHLAKNGHPVERPNDARRLQ